MTTYPFPSQIALDVNGDLVTAGSGSIYAYTDTGFTTPLALTDESGGAKSTVAVSSLGATEYFATTDEGVVWWKSGSLPAVLLVSFQGYADAAAASQVAAEAAQTAAEGAESVVLATTDDAIAAFIADDTTPSATRAALDAVLAGPIKGEAGRDLRLVAGVIRNDGSPSYWQPIDDSGHSPVNVDSVSTTTSAIVVDFTSLGASKIVSFAVVPDEQFAKLGFTAGASVSLTQAAIYLQQVKPFADYVYYDGSAWQSSNGVFSLSFNPATGVLTCTHEEIPAGTAVFDVSVTGRGTLLASSHGASTSTALVRWHNYSGTLQTAASTDMKAFVSHGSNGPLDPQQIDTTKYPSSNLWFIAIVEV